MDLINECIGSDEVELIRGELCAIVADADEEVGIGIGRGGTAELFDDGKLGWHSDEFRALGCVY